MRIPVKLGIEPGDIIIYLLSKARACFWASRDVLQSTAPLGQLLRILYKTSWQAMAWVIGAIHPTRQTLETLNSVLIQVVIIVAKIKRRPQKFFIEFCLRSRRVARYLLHQSGLERWSTLHARLCWRYTGHRARGATWAHPHAASILSGFQDPQWGREQQGLLQGAKHKRRHFPRITNEEKIIAQTAGREWRQLALDKPAWDAREDAFVAAIDPPWANLLTSAHWRPDRFDDPKRCPT